jgi:uncharacterized membrane protein YhaH (DUF805 family)
MIRGIRSFQFVAGCGSAFGSRARTSAGREALRPVLALLLVSFPAWAQQRRSNEDAAAAAGCALCSTLLLVPVAIFALNIALLVWVARDAKSRGMDSAVIWMLLVMFTSVVGLGIYIFSRPQGELMQCVNCRNQRMQASTKCPHCGSI